MKITIGKWMGFMLILFLVENAYFGWNRMPESKMEWVFDIVIGGICFVGSMMIGIRDYKEDKKGKNNE